MDELETLTYEVTGRIARITLNRPERGNGITLEIRASSPPAWSGPISTPPST
jgi:enoyl-CoA hydratase/carnithine racemase